MRILIIRHGDPQYDDKVIGLTKAGQTEVKLLAKKLKKEKIDKIYCSPLIRAISTCIPTAKAKKMDYTICEWLKEFGGKTVTKSGQENNIPWDLLPEEWANESICYTDSWLDFDDYKSGDVKERYKVVTDEFYKILASHGYRKEGKIFKVERENDDTVAFFCHFGLECVLLSYLLNIPAPVLWHNTCAAPSSVTTVYTEERREGIAIMRCQSFGDTGHLYKAKKPIAFSARFCETFHSDDRHD